MPTRRIGLAALVLLPLLLLAAPLAEAKKPPKPPPPPPSPADPAIVSRERTESNLWVMNEDGSNATQIYTGDTWRMSWSPDGTSIAFTGPDHQRELWRIDVDVVDGVPQGSNLTRLVAAPDTVVFFPAWSPLGGEIAYLAGVESAHGTDPGELRLVPAAGGTSQLLYAAPTGRKMLGGTWSPDGTRIAFLEKIDPGAYRYIRILEVATGTITTHELPVSNMHRGFYGLAWARTRDVLAYEATTRVPDGGNRTREATFIHTIDLATGVITAIVEGDMPCWSPDDLQIVFRAPVYSKGRWPKGDRLFTYAFATGEVTQIAGDHKSPDWRR